MRERRKPRPLTPGRLERRALHYLERYAAPSTHLRRILLRWMREADDCRVTQEHVDALVERLVAAELLDDRRYARDRAAALHRRGNSVRLIRAKLADKGLRGELVDDALAALGADSELQAARGYARKRRLGHWGDRGDDRERWRKDLGRLARRGFSFDVADKALRGPTD